MSLRMYCSTLKLLYPKYEHLIPLCLTHPAPPPPTHAFRLYFLTSTYYVVRRGRCSSPRRWLCDMTQAGGEEEEEEVVQTQIGQDPTYYIVVGTSTTASANVN